MIQSVWKNLTGLQKAAEHLWCDFKVAGECIYIYIYIYIYMFFIKLYLDIMDDSNKS